MSDNKWLKLSEGYYMFGDGGVTRIETVDMRDKPTTYTYRTELYSGKLFIERVKETPDEIMEKLNES